jgi:hypothetical protein
MTTQDRFQQDFTFQNQDLIGELFDETGAGLKNIDEEGSVLIEPLNTRD